MHDFGLGIVRKSDGVFVWVRLLVKAIIRGTQNGDQLSDLQAHLDELPADLERLYRHMLLRVPQRYRVHSARIFAIVHASTEPPLALALWHSGEEVTNPMKKLTDDIKLAQCYQVHLRLVSQCAGLLEIRIAGVDHGQHEQDDSRSHATRRVLVLFEQADLLTVLSSALHASNNQRLSSDERD